jgi:hypothetical protein
MWYSASALVVEDIFLGTIRCDNIVYNGFDAESFVECKERRELGE